MITIPTISQLYNDILTDIQAEYGNNIPSFGKNFLRALALVQAGKLKLYYLAIGNLQKNIFIDTADPQSKGGTLERFGRIKLGRDPFPATAGQYTVQVAGTIGSTINASTTFKSNDDSINPGKLFILDNAFVLVTGTDLITLRSLEAGIESKLEVGDQLTATAPIAGVNKTVTITAESIAPLAAEDIEEYRAKGIESYRLEAQGGAAADYRLWAADAQGVRQVYPYAKAGAPTEINLFIEATEADSTDGKGTPSSQLLLDVENVVELDPDTTIPINERGRRPLGVAVIYYLPVTLKEININIAGFAAITAELETLIFNAIKLELDSIRPFVSAADILADKNDIFDTNKIISIVLAVQPGSVFGAVTLEVDGAPVGTYTFTNGDIPTLNTITYV